MLLFCFSEMTVAIWDERDDTDIVIVGNITLWVWLMWIFLNISIFNDSRELLFWFIAGFWLKFLGIFSMCSNKHYSCKVRFKLHEVKLNLWSGKLKTRGGLDLWCLSLISYYAVGHLEYQILPEIRKNDCYGFTI